MYGIDFFEQTQRAISLKYWVCTTQVKFDDASRLLIYRVYGQGEPEAGNDEGEKFASKMSADKAGAVRDAPVGDGTRVRAGADGEEDSRIRSPSEELKKRRKEMEERLKQLKLKRNTGATDGEKELE